MTGEITGEAAPASTASPQAAAAMASAPVDWVTGPDLEPGDAYMEGPYVVFTAQYHLRRGSCCHSECRHCPYREA